MMYSKMVLISHITAIMNDPKRRLPALYLIVHQYPLNKLKSPLVCSFSVKYHETTATIKIYYVHAMMKAVIQKNKKAVYHIRYFYFLWF